MRVPTAETNVCYKDVVYFGSKAITAHQPINSQYVTPRVWCKLFQGQGRLLIVGHRRAVFAGDMFMWPLLLITGAAGWKINRAKSIVDFGLHTILHSSPIPESLWHSLIPPCPWLCYRAQLSLQFGHKGGSIYIWGCYVGWGEGFTTTTPRLTCAHALTFYQRSPPSTPLD